MTSSTPHRGRARRADIQGLRAVAVGLVVAFHAGLPISGGFIGVDVFFVISGFVIAAMLLREVGTGRGLGFATFYARRMRRLLPALAVLTTFVALASTLLLSPLGPQQATARTGIGASLFSANLQLWRTPGGGYFDLSSDTNALLHTWSLSVEEQFYLVFPAFLLGLWWLACRRPVMGTPRRTVGLLLTAVALASFALSVVTTYHPSYRLGTSFAFYMAPARAWEFGAGVLLALGVPRLRRLGVAASTAAGVLGAALLIFAALVLDGTTAFPGLSALYPVVATMLIIVGGTGAAGRNPVARALSVRPAVWVGDVSYGWYLWHWPFIVFAAAMWPGRDVLMVVAAVAALLPTIVSYRLVENPIRFNDRLVGRRVVPVVAACIVIPLVAFAGLLVFNRAQVKTDAIADFKQDMRLHEDRQRGCDDPRSLADRSGDDCTWVVAGAKGTIHLVGDSNAGHFTEPVAAAANRSGYDLTVTTAAGCPFVDLIRRSTAKLSFDGEACHDAVLETIDALEQRHPSLVVIAASSSELINDPVESLRDPKTGEVATSAKDKARLWQRGLTTVLRDLGDAGIPTVVLHAVPQFNETLGGDWHGESCPALRIYADSCGGSRSRASVVRTQRLAASAERRAVAAVDRSTAIGFDDELCTKERCATSRGSLHLYRDSTHLTVDGAKTLTPTFERLFRQILS